MAQLSISELEQCLEALAGDGSIGKLRDRFVRHGAFHARKGIGTAGQLAQRLWTLSSGLKRTGPALNCFQGLWMEWVGQHLDEELGQRIDAVAGAINEALDDGQIRADMRQALEDRLGEYESLLATRLGPAAARLDTLQKALPVVAEILRNRPLPVPATDVPEPSAESHVHGPGCAHGHDHSGASEDGD